MTALRLWFAERSRRERRLILAALALTVLVLVWAGVLRPLGDALAGARERQADAALRLARIRADVAVLRGLDAGRGTLLAGTLADTVRAEADAAGFTLASLDPQGPDRVRIGIASARGGALIAWLARLERRGVLVEAAQLTDHGDRTLGVDLTLGERGR